MLDLDLDFEVGDVFGVGDIIKIHGMSVQFVWSGIGEIGDQNVPIGFCESVVNITRCLHPSPLTILSILAYKEIRLTIKIG